MVPPILGNLQIMGQHCSAATSMQNRFRVAQGEAKPKHHEVHHVEGHSNVSLQTTIMGFIGYIMGLYWDNGKENGNYCSLNLLPLVSSRESGTGYNPYLNTIAIATIEKS